MPSESVSSGSSITSLCNSGRSSPIIANLIVLLKILAKRSWCFSPQGMSTAADIGDSDLVI